MSEKNLDSTPTTEFLDPMAQIVVVRADRTYDNARNPDTHSAGISTGMNRCGPFLSSFLFLSLDFRSFLLLLSCTYSPLVSTLTAMLPSF